MEVTGQALLLVPLTLVMIGATTWGLLVVLRGPRPAHSLSLDLLGAVVGTFLFLYAEVHVLSLLPGPRPLDWLPIVHVGLLAALLATALMLCGWGVWTRTARDLARAVLGPIRQAPLVMAPAATLAAACVLAALLWGAYRVPSGWDELEYHVPNAIQPYQDGRVLPFVNDVPWITGYPRGMPTIWYWTLRWTGGDLLFHPAQGALGLQLALAVYLLARRSGARPWAAALGGAIVMTMPVFFVLASSGYIDLPVAAATVTIVAVLAPVPGGGDARRDGMLAVLALAQAMLIKAPLLALAVGGVAALEALLLRHGPMRGLVAARRFVGSWRGAAALFVLALAAHPYWENWLRRGNPLHPLRVTLAGHTVWDGPVDAGLFGTGGHTTAAKPVAEMTRWERFWYGWTDWNVGHAVDAFGLFGSVLPLGLLLPLAIFAVASLLRPWTWGAALCVMFAVGCLTPAYLPRYGLSFICIAIVAGAWLLSNLRRDAARAFGLILVALSAHGVWRSYVSLRDSVDWTRAVLGGSLLHAERNSFVHTRLQQGDPECYPSPEMISFIRAHSGRDDVLVYLVRSFATPLWNSRYTNRIRYLEGTPAERYPSSPRFAPSPSAAQLADWLARLERMRPRHVLVYSASDYAAALRDSAAYRVALEDPAPRGPGAMVLFERTGPAAPGAPP
jgi:hypothetical protein